MQKHGLAKGTYLFDLGKHKEAQAAYENSLDLDPENAVGWTRHGMALAAQQQSEAAIESYDRAIAIDPAFSIAYFTKGTAYIALRQYREAVDAFSMMITIQPDFVDAWIYKGQALKELGKVPGSPDYL